MVIELYNLYVELSSVCVEGLPAVQERLQEIERLVTRLECIAMFVLNYFLNSQQFKDA
jgi:hypothetical protein